MVIENHKRYLERITLYKNFGYDIEGERKFIIEKTQPIYGDILEVGTGKGYFAIELAKKGYKFRSVDISKDEQELARLNLEYFGLEKQVDFKIEDAENLSFEDKEFDIIFSVNMFHHLENPFKVINELTRVTSFEGKIILSDFSKEGLELVDKVHKSEGRVHPASIFNLNDIAKFLLDKKFRIEKHRSKFQEVIIVCQPNI